MCNQKKQIPNKYLQLHRMTLKLLYVRKVDF